MIMEFALKKPHQSLTSVGSVSLVAKVLTNWIFFKSCEQMTSRQRHPHHHQEPSLLPSPPPPDSFPNHPSLLPFPLRLSSRGVRATIGHVPRVPAAPEPTPHRRGHPLALPAALPPGASVPPPRSVFGKDTQNMVFAPNFFFERI